MCGIMGAVAKRDITNVLVDGLKSLEYRGYDSAGIGGINEENHLFRIRIKGKVNELANEVAKQAIKTSMGIAHTRWATHGKPSEVNAHPHVSNDTIAIVHNGIIENYAELREQLIAKGYVFSSDTDTEVVAHLLHEQLADNNDVLAVLQQLASKLQGAFALGVLYTGVKDKLYAVRKGSPLVIGLGDNENFFSSDYLALINVTQRFISLEDGDIAEISVDGIKLVDKNGQEVERPIEILKVTQDSVDLGEYRHFMQKEIFEQPEAIRQTVMDRLGDSHVLEELFGQDALHLLDKTRMVHIVACGTSYHAGLIARYWLESLAGIPCSVEIASEYRYREPIVLPGTLFIAISQSGETADTLSALRRARTLGYLGVLSICNVEQSAMVRESDMVILTRAGREIGVASTKAFTTQLSVLLLLTLLLGRRHRLDAEQEAAFIKILRELPHRVQDVLRLDESIRLLAQRFADKQQCLFLGRGIHHPVVLEGALKLKEISYIHAQAYPAGELKHGPLALVDKNMVVVAVAPNDMLLEKLKSNLQEVQARGGELIIFSDNPSSIKNSLSGTVVDVPSTPDLIAPIVYTIPLQLLAYHVALLKGTDVDQPRNLAKSVTVE